MALFRLNHKNIHNGILFNALYSAIIFGVMFLVNDYIHDYVVPYLEKKRPIQDTMKLLLHVVVTFVTSLIVVYLLWWLFGWGKALTES